MLIKRNLGAMLILVALAILFLFPFVYLTGGALKPNQKLADCYLCGYAWADFDRGSSGIRLCPHPICFPGYAFHAVPGNADRPVRVIVRAPIFDAR